ncbi:MAG: hypothetical protein M1839_005353 [Geoglossum umbratile]|nr:MAG: hypothetical protein M1839_005353 [Geoglossum umbratile]
MAPSGNIHLRSILKYLVANPSTEIPNPPNCRKRASVALIIRIRPHPAHWPPEKPDHGSPDYCKESSNLTTDRLDEFFSLPWVQNGDPEVLFIKRATRTRDRWGGHVALPGGRRDSGDESDQAVAVRETWEEVGMDLSPQNCIFVGNLPERVVSTSWGRVPLMVLCSFIYVLTEHNIPPLRLQRSEVGSAHWVSLRALLSPSLRTYEYCDVSDRLANRGTDITRTFLRIIFGQMVCAAVKLMPSESLYSDIPSWLDLEDSVTAGSPLINLLRQLCTTDHAGSANRDRPLLLWGLTLAILTDFLHLPPTYNALSLWTYPTLTPPDIQFMVWIMTYSFRGKKQLEFHQLQTTNPKLAIQAPLPNEFNFGNGVTGRLMDGYYNLFRRAVVVALLARVTVAVGFATALCVRYRRGRNLSSLRV